MAGHYRLTRARKIANSLLKAAIRTGFLPSRTRILIVQGRTSGRQYSTPVNLVFRNAERYLVAPYGEVAWVKNARAAGEVQLQRGSRLESVGVEPPDAVESAQVLRQYLRENPATRPSFDVKLDSSDDQFIREAPAHPVFRLKAR